MELIKHFVSLKIFINIFIIYLSYSKVDQLLGATTSDLNIVKSTSNDESGQYQEKVDNSNYLINYHAYEALQPLIGNKENTIVPSQQVYYESTQEIVTKAPQPTFVQQPSIQYQVVKDQSSQYQVVQEPSPQYQIVQEQSPQYQIVQEPSPQYQIAQEQSPQYQVVQQPAFQYQTIQEHLPQPPPDHSLYQTSLALPYPSWENSFIPSTQFRPPTQHATAQVSSQNSENIKQSNRYSSFLKGIYQALKQKREKLQKIANQSNHFLNSKRNRYQTQIRNLYRIAQQQSNSERGGEIYHLVRKHLNTLYYFAKVSAAMYILAFLGGVHGGATVAILLSFLYYTKIILFKIFALSKSIKI
jgi:hypothetical protein